MTSLRKFINKCSANNEELYKNCRVDKNLVRSRLGLELSVFIKKLIMTLVSLIFSHIASGSVLVNLYKTGKSLKFLEDWNGIERP